MEKESLDYSTKNIPVPSRKLYRKILTGKTQKFIHNARWRGYFCLHPNEKSPNKETYGLKSTSPAPFVQEMKIFEEKLAKLITNVKFDRKPNHFQRMLKTEETRIKSETRVFVKGDKSNNYYKMEGDDYKKIVEKEIHKEYKKMTPNELKNVTKAQEKVVKNLELEDRVFETTQRQCFATVKDHKENFPNKVTARLINPMSLERFQKTFWKTLITQ